MRYPAKRKLIKAFKIQCNCIIRLMHEYLTSQKCTKCFRRFDRRAKSFWNNLCADCRLSPYTFWSENITWPMQRTMMCREMRDKGNVIAATLTQSNTHCLVLRKHRFFKTWQPICKCTIANVNTIIVQNVLNFTVKYQQWNLFCSEVSDSKKEMKMITCTFIRMYLYLYFFYLMI